MKSAYELAMERLNRQSPTLKLSSNQKKRLAEVDTLFAAKIAEKEIQLKDEMGRAAAAGDAEKFQQIEERLLSERRKLQANLEEQKEKIRTEAK